MESPTITENRVSSSVADTWDLSRVALGKPALSMSKPRSATAEAVFHFLLLLDVALLVVSGALLLLDSPSHTLSVLFNLQGEATIPAWYASAKLLLLSGLIGMLAIASANGTGSTRSLAAAAFVFFVMSCDESAGMHERLQLALNIKVLEGALSGVVDTRIAAKFILGFAALFVVTVVVAALVSALRRCPAGRVSLVCGFFLLAAGAVGIDLLQEVVLFSGVVASSFIIGEEVLELSGVTMMIYGVLQALRVAPVTLRLGPTLSLGSGMDRL